MEFVLFAISALASAVSSVTVATLYVWPRLRSAKPNQALAILVAPHLFLRFFGLSLLVPGVVALPLPRLMATWSREAWPSSRPLRWQDKRSGPGPPSGRSTSGEQLT